MTRYEHIKTIKLCICFTKVWAFQWTQQTTMWTSISPWYWHTRSTSWLCRSTACCHGKAATPSGMHQVFICFKLVYFISNYVSLMSINWQTVWTVSALAWRSISPIACWMRPNWNATTAFAIVATRHWAMRLAAAPIEVCWNSTATGSLFFLVKSIGQRLCYKRVRESMTQVASSGSCGWCWRWHGSSSY